MIVSMSSRFAMVLSCCLIATFFPVHATWGQFSTQSENALEATLVVEGRVVNIFRAPDSNRIGLVQMLVQKSEAQQPIQPQRSVRYPAPGEYLFVQLEAGNGGIIGGRESTASPRSGMYIRAQLRPGDHQDWLASDDWFQEVGTDSAVVAAPPSGQPLGISTEQVSLGSRRALKVTAVETGSPAAAAGLEVGDILVSANNVDVTRPEQLVEQVLNSDGLLKLLVRDVRTGRDVPVEVKWDSAMSGKASTGPTRSLGVTTQVAFIDGKAALKVMTVAEGSPARQSGLEPGLIILTADGNPLPKPSDLADAEKQAKGILVLRIVDPKTREERTVRVDLR